MNTNNNYEENFSFQKRYYKDIETILKQNALCFIKIRIASEIEDQKQATDFVVVIEGGEVAIRIRRNIITFRDFTLRTKSQYGGKTELPKIKEGWAKFYLYCWENEQRKIEEWLLIDLDKTRNSGLLEIERKIYINWADGTEFISISQKELIKENCIISYNLKNLSFFPTSFPNATPSRP